MNPRRIVWGVPEEIKPIANLPGDTMWTRLRFRNKDFARVFILTPNGIRHFPISINEIGQWVIEHDLEQGRNWRPRVMRDRRAMNYIGLTAAQEE